MAHYNHKPNQTSMPHANTIPVGLFSFSMMVGLETVALMTHLIPGSVSESFVLTWGPYMFFVGGVMQVIVGIFQTLRGNLYGATAFLVFGNFWFSNGLVQLLRQFGVTETTPAAALFDDSDPWGTFLRNVLYLPFPAHCSSKHLS